MAVKPLLKAPSTLNKDLTTGNIRQSLQGDSNSKKYMKRVRYWIGLMKHSLTPIEALWLFMIVIAMDQGPM